MVTCTVREVRRAGGRLISPVTQEPEKPRHDGFDDMPTDEVGFVDPGHRSAAAPPAWARFSRNRHGSR